MSREVKIGLFAVISLAIAFFGYNFLKGKDLFSNSNLFYVHYSQIDGLQSNSPINMNGLQVGTVKDIYLLPEDYSKIMVELEVQGDINIPKNTKAVIYPSSFMGGMAVMLKFDGFCSGADCAQSGEYLQGMTMSMLDNYIGADNLKEYTDVVTTGVQGLIDSVSGDLKDPNSEVGKSLKDVDATIVNLKYATAQMNSLLKNSSQSMTQTMANLEKITANLAAQNAQINSILSNTSTFTNNLNAVDLKGTAEGANTAMASLKTTLENTDKTMAEVTSLMKKIQAGDGTLGMLVNDGTLYKKLNDASQQMELLMQDLRLNPSRYTRILRKKRKAYEKPENDPGLN